MRTAIIRVTRLIWSVTAAVARLARRLLRRPGDRPAPWNADLLDDLAFDRPWNVATKAARQRALIRLRRRDLRRGETVVIVNWNTLAVLKDTLRAVTALTPPAVLVRVIDNGSTDGSREWLRAQTGLKVDHLPTNVGHAVALDLAVLTCTTDVAVILDSDAVPLTEDWIDTVVDPLRDDGLVLFGTRSRRAFVHPMFMAVDVAEFTRRRLTFAVHQAPGATDATKVWGSTAFDTGEWLTRMVDRSEIGFLETTPNRVEGLAGMTVGDAVYHHGGVTRAAEGGLTPESLAEWQQTLEAILPPGARPTV